MIVRGVEAAQRSCGLLGAVAEQGRRPGDADRPRRWRACRSLPLSGRMFVSVIHGLSAIARWMSPAAIGLAIKAWTLVPPADSPKIVTLSGSPPNCAMFRSTHWSAAIWSRKP